MSKTAPNFLPDGEVHAFNEGGVQQRQVDPGLLHAVNTHLKKLLGDWGIEVSINGAGTWYDNAAMKSFFGTLKGERVYHHAYRTRVQARADIFYYIEAFYNTTSSALDAWLSQSYGL